MEGNIRKEWPHPSPKWQLASKYNEFVLDGRNSLIYQVTWFVFICPLEAVWAELQIKASATCWMVGLHTGRKL